MPHRIGPYKILRVLGEGGMGTVYLAEQKKPIRRRVALKVIKLGMATKEVIARFEAERQALALMNHPCIAHVLDVGTTAEGQAYFAMEHVPGLRITDYCNENDVGLDERVELFQEVCLAVQHAHQKCVLHRDIKPSNILVHTRNGVPVPTIIDFGVAKATDHSLTERSLFTEQGRLIGTPAYMSPEQADRSGLDVDARADIYSLGVLLYELLTGFLPFSPRELQQAGIAEIQRRIREDEPPKPSTRLKTTTQKTTMRGDETQALAQRFHANPSALVRAIKGDLDWITMRCLEKDPNRRYQSASELAADLQRHLAHEPVDASPPSPVYRLRKFLRKRRGPVAAGALMLFMLVAGLAIAIGQARLAEASRRVQVSERRRVEVAESEAKRSEAVALQKERETKADLARYQQMTDVPLAEDLVQEAERDLWPAHPRVVAAMERWLVRARDFVGDASMHREKLKELQKKGLPPRPEVQRKLDQLTRFQSELDATRKAHDETVAASTTSRTARRRLPQTATEVAQLEAKVNALDAETREQRWQFKADDDRFMYGHFAGLVTNIDRLEGKTGLIAEVELRRQRAATLRVRSLEDPKEDWQRVLAAIAVSEKYAEMPALTPQLGLVPLGPDPQSKLEEFAVLDTGAVPKRAENGSLLIDGVTAIVLVLLPPGTFAMGAQSSDPQLPNYDPQAESIESPVLEVKLDAFLLSKYEMTQGQWLRVTETNPSSFSPGKTVGGRTSSAQNPVETVSWYDCSAAMSRLGLVLPTEAQWEYGARAGTTTAWATGQAPSSLDGAANISHEDTDHTREVDHEDGHYEHAAVGSFRANRFGLHDVIGNVFEWCRDYGSYSQVAGPGDGLRRHAGIYRVYRGGSIRSLAHRARSGHRQRNSPDHGFSSVGFRPSKVISR